MNGQFFSALLAFTAGPKLVSKILRADSLIPIAYIQVIFGALINVTGAEEWLRERQVHLAGGSLVDSLQGLGWVGVSLLIALTGNAHAPSHADPYRWRFVPISVVGFGGTFTLGTLIGYVLVTSYPELSGSMASPWTFAFATGVSLSVTALPILVAILQQTRLSDTFVGRLAVSCTLLDDVWMWLGLGMILSFTQAAVRPPVITLILLLAYLAVMLFAIKPFLEWWFAKNTDISRYDRMLISLSAIFLSSILTDAIGVHGIFGAFMGGAVLPKEVVRDWAGLLMDIVATLLLPLFFVFTGMRLHIAQMDLFCLALTLVVTIGALSGKMISVILAARAMKLPWSECFVLGSLMQSKGLMELVAITILLEAGVIGEKMFSALALMALVTTAIAIPLTRFSLKRIDRPHRTVPAE